MGQIYARCKLFKNTNLKISFKTENTIGKLLAHNKNKNTNFNKFNKSSVYELTCHVTSLT